MISRESLNEAYSGLEAKHNEIIRTLTHRIFELESGWKQKQVSAMKKERFWWQMGAGCLSDSSYHGQRTMRY